MLIYENDNFFFLIDWNTTNTWGKNWNIVTFVMLFYFWKQKKNQKPGAKFE